LLDLKDESPLEEFEDAENKTPSARKVNGDHTLYNSRRLRASIATLGLPVLIDFGEARDGHSKHRDEIMPDPYRAPEVVIDVPWDNKVDIWNMGVLVRL
jgi:hypothetical protein